MISCNTCNSKNIDHVFDNSIKSTARLPKIPYKVLICKDCGHVFLDYFFLEQKDLENYYSNNNPFEKVEQLLNLVMFARKIQILTVLEQRARFGKKPKQAAIAKKGKEAIRRKHGKKKG